MSEASVEPTLLLLLLSQHHPRIKTTTKMMMTTSLLPLRIMLLHRLPPPLHQHPLRLLGLLGQLASSVAGTCLPGPQEHPSLTKLTVSTMIQTLVILMMMMTLIAITRTSSPLSSLPPLPELSVPHAVELL